jgi:hypothetical protein
VIATSSAVLVWLALSVTVSEKRYVPVVVGVKVGLATVAELSVTGAGFPAFAVHAYVTVASS